MGRRPGHRSSAHGGARADPRARAHADRQMPAVTAYAVTVRRWSAHSTVTVLARLRGWSTLSPRSRAVW
jgi:hypothetical protein